MAILNRRVNGHRKIPKKYYVSCEKHVDVLTYNYFNLMNGFKMKSYLYYALNT